MTQHRLAPHFAPLIATLIACSSSSSGEADSGLPADAGRNCQTATVEEMMQCVEEARISADIETIAMERTPGSTHWQSMQDLCKDRLEDAGFEVELHSYDTGVNVIGRRMGSDASAGDVLVTAHYDHIAGCPGASDNAAGMAAVLEIARLLGKRELHSSLVIACWDEEEKGLIGSRAYAERASASGQTIRAMLSLDALGYMSSEPNSQAMPDGFDQLFPDIDAQLAANQYRGDFISLIADEASATIVASLLAHAETAGLTFISLVLSDALKVSSLTRDLRRSDHGGFWEAGFPGVHLSDTGDFRNPNYHCFNGSDLPGTLEIEAVTQVTQATLGAVIDAVDAP